MNGSRLWPAHRAGVAIFAKSEPEAPEAMLSRGRAGQSTYFSCTFPITDNHTHQVAGDEPGLGETRVGSVCARVAAGLWSSLCPKPVRAGSDDANTIAEPIDRGRFKHPAQSQVELGAGLPAMSFTGSSCLGIHGPVGTISTIEKTLGYRQNRRTL
jgi:hypothetical protein